MRSMVCASIAVAVLSFLILLLWAQTKIESFQRRAAINPRRPFSMKVAKEKDPVRLRSAEDIEADEREKGLVINGAENRHQRKEVAA